MGSVPPVYWADADEEVCLADVVDVVNEAYENTLHTLLDGCATTSSPWEAAKSVQVMPNPMGDFSTVRFPLAFGTWK